MKNYLLIPSLLFLLTGLQIAGTAQGHRPLTKSELAYIHTDRDIYLTGEYLFFKVYVANAENLLPTSQSSIAYLSLYAPSGTPVSAITIKLTSGMGWGSIYLNDTIRSGAYRLRPYTNLMKNQGSLSNFSKEITIINQFDNLTGNLIPSLAIPHADTTVVKQTTAIPVTVTQLMNEYKTGDSAKFEIRLSDLLSDSVCAHLSVNIAHEHSLSDHARSFLSYVQQMKTESLSPGNSSARVNYLPEKFGQLLTGRVINRETKRPVKNCMVLLSCTDSIVNLSGSNTDSCGTFRFRLSDYNITKKCYLSFGNQLHYKELQIIPDQRDFEPETAIPVLPLTDTILSKHIRQAELFMSIHKIYNTQPGIIEQHFTSTATLRPMLYKVPTEVFYPSEYLPLKDFKEIAAELSFQISVLKQRDQYQIECNYPRVDGEERGAAAIFLNGRHLDESSTVLRMGSASIKKIEVMNAPVVCGSQVFNGIVAIFTPDGMNDTTDTRNSLPPLLFHPVSTPARIAEDGENAASLPDFRHLLFWEPEVFIAKEHPATIRFKTSGLRGKYLIHIEGMTSSGQIISYHDEILIK
ncbi:MAG TPA: hypothetical protein DEO70_00500 [Bacteroidales bacterium]|nr:MAG: hypothetical protein A2X11_03240 [Bacteroidetes bacterium GWE2_42_24]HBZ65288.1 hypothetical protein [Bacteroidales bacterium]